MCLRSERAASEWSSSVRVVCVWCVVRMLHFYSEKLRAVWCAYGVRAVLGSLFVVLLLMTCSFPLIIPLMHY